MFHFNLVLSFIVISAFNVFFIFNFRRIGPTIDDTKRIDISENATDQEIYEKLMKLKEDKQENMQKGNNGDIINRLKKLKGDIPSTSTAELEARLANIKGVPISAVQTKVIFIIFYLQVNCKCLPFKINIF